MRVLKSLGGPGRSVKMGEMYKREHGDLFVVYYPYCLNYPFNAYFISSEQENIYHVILFVRDMIENGFAKNVYIYGDFDEDDIEMLKFFSKQYNDSVKITVTHKLPENTHSSSEGLGPFVIEEV